MLRLTNIKKDYSAGDTTVEALKGISLSFRKNEFVSILGPSGCGKTTLLNIIGGLDRYTDGDLSVNNVSTKLYKDNDWDAYRNHSIGFVFQNYNLIPHQSVLSNVELALTLSGISKAERRERAKKVLEQVGLADQMKKKPNQMSGGQMQRVAIARALINDPDILLADEPTGALDSETSIQVMEILKNISKDRLIIMVTHNPDLADAYSTRIIRLLDGEVKDDTNPYDDSNDTAANDGPTSVVMKKPSMSFFTAVSLSLNNLMTKKARTFLTAFAGSIGIIGIALILSLSSGVQNYISKVEEDTLSSYPLTIEKATVDISSLLLSTAANRNNEITHENDKVYSNNIMEQMMSTMISEISVNDLKSFKEFIDNGGNGMEAYVNDIKYGYDTQLNIYKSDTSDGVVQINPSQVFNTIGMEGMASSPMTNTNIWTELLGNTKLLESQYEVIAGRIPTDYDEVVIVVDENNEISDFALYSLGLKDYSELNELITSVLGGESYTAEQTSYSYDELLSLTFKLVPNTSYYEQTGDVWTDHSKNESYMKKVIENATEVKVVGILKPADDALTATTTGFVGYTSALTIELIEQVNSSAVVAAQTSDPDTDIFTGKPFETGEETPTFDYSSLTPEQLAYMQTLSEEELAAMMDAYAADSVSYSTYDDNLATLGVADLDNPSSISIYPSDFEAKDKLVEIIKDYNKRMTDDGKEENIIQYTDYVGLLMSSVSTIINAISYILIAFVAISLVVSSIMIGIITYISVLERTKEIGILRSIGASKRDISRVFNAETLIVGLTAGLIGIGVTLLLNIPINLIITKLTDISNLSKLPPLGGVILIGISMVLTFIAGLIPSKIAAKKDPVVALRTE